MTAEIVVMNANAVAMAADSFTTIGESKTCGSDMKLFRLSESQPVGIMTYGRADFMGVDWETVIKMFQKELGNTSYKTLGGYSKRFIEFLSGNKKFEEAQKKDTSFESGVGAGFHRNIVEDIGNDEEAKDFFSRKILDIHGMLSNIKPIYDNTNKSFEKKIQNQYKDEIEKAKKNVFQVLEFDSSIDKKLNEIAAMFYTRTGINSSGIVIAGFGEDEIYPVVENYEVGGVLCGELISRKIDGTNETDENCRSISNIMDAHVIPFAQTEMVKTFMGGVSPEMVGCLGGFLVEEIDKNLLTGTDKDKKNFIKQYQKKTDDFFENLKKVIGDKQSEVLNMVTALPKKELAEMAETLVNLTAFKQRVTDKMQTVGGEIDVAVISKGDGFKWIKRKNYFPDEIN